MGCADTALLMKRLWPHLVLASAFVLALAMPIYSAYADTTDAGGVVTIPPPEGSASVVVDAGAGTVDAAPTPTPSSPVVTPDSNDATLAKTLYNAIHSKDWFLAVGAACALLIHLAKWLLKKKWPSFEKDRWGWALAAGISGVVALSAAWLAGETALEARSLIGALKIFAGAVLAYVSTKKLASPE